MTTTKITTINSERFIQLSEEIGRNFDDLRERCYRLERENFCPGTQGECIAARNIYFEIERKIKELESMIPQKQRKTHLRALLESQTVSEDEHEVSGNKVDEQFEEIRNAMIEDLNEIIERFDSYDGIMVHVHKWAIIPRQNYNPASGRICVYRYN